MMNIENRLKKLENENFSNSAYSAFCSLPKAERQRIAAQDAERMKRLSDGELERIFNEGSLKLRQTIKELSESELYNLSIGEVSEISFDTIEKLRSAGFRI